MIYTTVQMKKVLFSRDVRLLKVVTESPIIESSGNTKTHHTGKRLTHLNGCSHREIGGKKMKMKRWMAVMLAGAMTLGTLAGCGSDSKSSKTDTGGASTNAPVAQANMPVDENGNPSPFGKYKDAVTVDIIQSINPTIPLPEGDSTTDNYYTRFIKENMNVDITVKWAASSADYNEKLNLAIASNDLPDILVVNEQQFRKLVQTEMLEDLTPYFDTYACDIIKQNIESTNGKAIANASADGKLYGLPGVQVEADGYNRNAGPSRTGWMPLALRRLPTIEEVETVAKAFVDNKMGGENTIGILGPTINGKVYNDFLSINNLNNLDGIFQAYKSWPGLLDRRGGRQGCLRLHNAGHKGSFRRAFTNV